MERLTERCHNLVLIKDAHNGFQYRAEWPKYIHRALERLAQYEDTGLMPEEVAVMSGLFEGMRKGRKDV